MDNMETELSEVEHTVLDFIHRIGHYPNLFDVEREMEKDYSNKLLKADDVLASLIDKGLIEEVNGKEIYGEDEFFYKPL